MSAKLVKVPSVKIGTDAEVAAQFNQLLRDAQFASKRIVAFGLYAWHVKLCLLKHGQFMAWVKAHCPDITHRAVQGHMSLAKSVMEACGIKSIRSALSNVKRASNLPLWELPLLPDAKTPDLQKPLNKKISDLIEGKSARQLFAEFKQADDDEDSKPKRGRLKGHGGATKEQRATAREADEKARVEAIELDAQDIIKLTEKHSDLQGFARLDLALLKKLNDAFTLGKGFTASLIHAQKGK